jgi:hypothetical protein
MLRIMTHALRFATLALLAAVCACASPQPEQGSADPEPGTCLDNEAGRAYMKSVWTTLQDAWELPKGIPPDQKVEVYLTFDAKGAPQDAMVAASSDEALRESVEAAIEEAELPTPPDEIRPCLARRAITGTFRNPDTGR